MASQHARGPNSNGYAEESNHISLGLVEWKRRQQWNPATNRAPPSRNKTSSSKLAKAGTSADLPHWETVNPIPCVQRQPATAEPPLRRHSDAKYADWINAMINILSGSGRSWALHEFFYSDIDRAWYVFRETCGNALVLPGLSDSDTTAAAV